MMMRKRAVRNACHPALITLCTSWQFSGKSSSLLSHQLSIGTAGPAFLCLFPSLAVWQLWLGTWPPILVAPSVSKILSLLWCLWPLAPLFQVGVCLALKGDLSWAFSVFFLFFFLVAEEVAGTSASTCTVTVIVCRALFLSVKARTVLPNCIPISLCPKICHRGTNENRRILDFESMTPHISSNW